MLRDILLDTDVIIEILRGNAKIKKVFNDLVTEGSRICFSPISSAEVHAGMRLGEEKSIAALFSSLDCIPIDEDTGVKAGQYLKTYSKSHGVELGDALIGATAASIGATLWTRNLKHYPMPDISHLG
jgi:predicted nucleic acid-binding protein